MNIAQNILTILSLLYIAFKAFHLFVALNVSLGQGIKAKEITIYWSHIAIQWFGPLIVVQSLFGAVITIINMKTLTGYWETLPHEYTYRYLTIQGVSSKIRFGYIEIIDPDDGESKVYVRTDLGPEITFSGYNTEKVVREAKDFLEEHAKAWFKKLGFGEIEMEHEKRLWD